MRKIIALLTDFGLKNNYVGVMKGVIKSISPEAEIIDITHSILPQNIKQAAFVLMNSYKYFPDGTIFLSIVDPEVGSDRLGIGTYINGKYFIAPNNGLLSYVIKNIKLKQFFSFDKSEFHLDQISSTFHGRDIFAPIAAHIANGKKLEEVGRKIGTNEIIIIPFPQCFLDIQGVWHGEVVEIDIFGNAITSLSIDNLKININDYNDNLRWKFESGDFKIKGLSKTFSDVKVGMPLVYAGSSGFIEIGIRDGNAAEKFGLEIGQNVYAIKE